MFTVIPPKVAPHPTALISLNMFTIAPSPDVKNVVLPEVGSIVGGDPPNTRLTGTPKNAVYAKFVNPPGNKTVPNNLDP